MSTSDEIDVQQRLDEQRGQMNPDGGKRRRAAGMRGFMWFIALVAVFILCGVSYLNWQRSSKAAPVVKPAEVKNTLPAHDWVKPAPEPVAVAAPAPGAAAPQPNFDVPPLPQATTMPPQGAAYSSQPREKTAGELARDRRLSGGFGGDTGGAPAKSKVSLRGNPNNAIENRLQPMQLQAATARHMGSLDFVITQGRMIDCGQQSMIITDQPGMVTCYVTSDVYSDNGHVVLIDAGTKVIGSYQSGIAQGQKRVFVAWARLITPQGVDIPLDSPGTDALGAAGETGQIDTHFWERFGGAIMLSLIGDLGKAVIGRAAGAGSSGGGNAIALNGTSETTDQASAEALRNTVNIPPTLYASQGGRVNIFVARDLDFSAVYEIKLVSN